MLLQSPDRQVPLDCPGSGDQANRQKSGTTENVEVHVGLRDGARLVQEVGPGQEKHSRQENPEIAVFFHLRLAPGYMRLSLYCEHFFYL